MRQFARLWIAAAGAAGVGCMAAGAAEAATDGSRSECSQAGGDGSVGRASAACAVRRASSIAAAGIGSVSFLAAARRAGM